MDVSVNNRIKSILNFVCPECGSRIVLVNAKEMHKGYKDQDMVRKCINCSFVSYIGDAKDHVLVNCDEFFNEVVKVEDNVNVV